MSQVTGDFLWTLQDCERLLKDNSKFKRTTANFVDNVVWHSSIERHVNNLRRRVHFHQAKVNFIAKPLECQLLIGIDQQLKEIKGDLAEIKWFLQPGKSITLDPDSTSSTTEEFLALPEEVESRLTEALPIDQPASFRAQEDLPLREAFDAVIFHFEKSTVSFKPNIALGQHVADPPQFLNLLK